MLKILSQEKAARRCEFPTVHGVIQTPAFMNVGHLRRNQRRRFRL